MKKQIAIFLALAVILSLCACGGGGEAAGGGETAQGLQVGFGRKVIMPEESVPMAGYTDSSQRMSAGYRDYLYATCIAFTEGEETVLMITQDLFKSDENWTAQVREKINADTGIPAERIMICATRNHAGPDISSSLPSITNYKSLYIDALAAAAKEALEDRAAATLSTVTTQTEKLNFPRHYTLSDGSYGGDNFGDFTTNAITGYANAGDPDMMLVKADREGQKQDVLIVNWQVYPCKLGVASDTNLSADFIGLVRTQVEKETGMLCAYFTGAAGDLKPESKILEDKLNASDEEYSQAIARCAIDALPGLTPVEGQGVASAQVNFEYAMNHEDAHLLAQAKEVVTTWNTEGLDAAKTLAAQQGFRSVYHAQQVTLRASRPEKGTMELNVIKVGGIAFVAAPFEMFSQSGIAIRQASPFAATVICECANEYQGNFATQEAYDYHSYESDINPFAKGCAEAVAEQFIQMLKSLQ